MPFRGEGEDTPDPALRRPLYPGDGRGPETRRDVTLPKSSCFWTLAAQRSLSREAPIRGREVCVKLVVLLTQRVTMLSTFYKQHRSGSTRRGRQPLNRLKLLAISALPLLLLSTSTTAQDDDDPTSSAAQSSTPFVDPVTGLPMERFFGARTQFGFAMALPLQSTASSSFIGQLTFPLVNGAGWGAMGLTGDMDGNFILAAWPDGAGGVMASFRQATDEDNPPEVQGNFQVRPITGGVSVDNTQLTYTFLCEECLNSTLGLGPEATVGNAVMGWALSERAVRNPAEPAANLGFHERGFGPFTARLSQARSAGFDAVAAQAALPVQNSGAAIEASVNVFDGDGDSGDESGDEGGDFSGAVGGAGDDSDSDDGDDDDD